MKSANYTYLDAKAWYQIGVEFNLNHDLQIKKTDLVEDYQGLVPLIIAKMQHNRAGELMWQSILKQPETKVKPFIIGLTGSVSVGKSTVANALKYLLKQTLTTSKIEVVTTDNFLYNNEILISENLMDQKGFPISYDTNLMIEFLKSVKEQKQNIKIPVYSHEYYDILPNEYKEIIQPDVVILEGVNALHRNGQDLSPVDLMDLSIYIDADTELIEKWFLQRFEKLVDEAKNEPTSYYNRFILDRKSATKAAIDVWQRVNKTNLDEFILPTRELADIIIKKGPKHRVFDVQIRKY